MLSIPLVLSPIVTTPAHAIIVFDPSNYAQNVIQAARALQQITNQITSLQNEAQMLINQAKNLASLPYSSLQQLQQSVQRTQQLLSQAQNIAYDVKQIDQAFQQKYANVSMSASDQQLVADARSRWQNTVGGLQDAMRVQATVVGNIDTNRTQMSALVGASQSATGALQATQAGNQLLALQAQQLADLTAVVAANGRAQALSDAERASAAEQGREQRRRFLTPAIEGGAMDGKTLARIGAVVFVAIAIVATAIEMNRKADSQDDAPTIAHPAHGRDPLDAELARCSGIARTLQVGGALMQGTGVIDHFLEVFTRYIDGGLGLLKPEVAFIATTLIVIDVTLAALFWSWG
eukprot:gene24686-26562_t